MTESDWAKAFARLAALTAAAGAFLDNDDTKRAKETLEVAIQFVNEVTQ